MLPIFYIDIFLFFIGYILYLQFRKKTQNTTLIDCIFCQIFMRPNAWTGNEIPVSAVCLNVFGAFEQGSAMIIDIASGRTGGGSMSAVINGTHL